MFKLWKPRKESKEPTFNEWFDGRYSTKVLDVNNQEPRVDGHFENGMLYPVAWDN